MEGGATDRREGACALGTWLACNSVNRNPIRPPRSIGVKRPYHRACTVGATANVPNSRRSRTNCSENGQSASLARCIRYELGELVWIEAGATDQGAIDVVPGDEFGDVVGLHRASVLDPNRGGCIVPEAFADRRPDGGTDLLGVLRGGRPARADRPDRLVGDDRARRLVASCSWPVRRRPGRPLCWWCRRPPVPPASLRRT